MARRSLLRCCAPGNSRWPMAHEIADEMTESAASEPSPEQVRAQRLYREMGLSDDEYERIRATLGREPNYVETGVFSVMWSEHCSYKSSKRVLRLLSSAGHPRVV